MLKDLGNMKKQSFEYVKVEETPYEQVKKGETHEGCTAKADFAIVRLRVTAKVDGKEDGEGMNALVAGAKYCLVDM